MNLHAFNKLILLTSLLGRWAKPSLICKSEISVLLKDMQLGLGKAGLKFSKECLSFVLQQLHHKNCVINMKYKHMIKGKKNR